MLKVLAVGNSFSQDATRYLEAVAGGALYVRNLYIGGCSLQTHVSLIGSDREAYEYQKDAEALHMITLDAGLAAEDWDIVTVQQVSGLSGIPESYEPWMGQLLAHIKAQCPKAKILFHRTWAYELDSTHPDFARYNNDRAQMYDRILTTTENIAASYGLPVIPAGDLIQKLRTQVKEYDYASGGATLNRDGFHLSDEGRYAAALVWYSILTGEDVSRVNYIPETVTKERGELLRNVAADFLSEQ